MICPDIFTRAVYKRLTKLKLTVLSQKAFLILGLRKLFQLILKQKFNIAKTLKTMRNTISRS